MKQRPSETDTTLSNDLSVLSPSLSSFNPAAFSDSLDSLDSSTLSKIDLFVRTEARRRKIVDCILLIVLLLQFALIPSSLFLFHLLSLTLLLSNLALCSLAFFCNQAGRTTLVALLLILVIDLDCTLRLFSSSSGLDLSFFPTFDLLALSSLIAVSLLPSKSVFLVALGNILFILLALSFFPRSPGLLYLLASPSAYDLIARPVCLQLGTALVSYLCVRGAHFAVLRANHATEQAQKHAMKLSHSFEHARVLSHENNLLRDELARLKEGSPLNQDTGVLRREVHRLNEALRVEKSFSRRTTSSL